MKTVVALSLVKHLQEKIMSETKRYIMSELEKGSLKYNQITQSYEETGMDILLDQKERLEYEIWASKRDLRSVIRKINRLSKELGL